MAQNSGCFPFVFVMFVLAIGGGAYWAGSQRFFETSPAEPASTPEVATERVNAGDVVLAVRHLARLETVEYHMERVVAEHDQQSRLFGILKAADSILLIAVGDVTAGVDLAALQEQDVQIDPSAGTAVLTLPAPEVFSARLDNARTRVYSRETDLLAQPGVEIESRARRNAEAEIRRAALEAGLLDQARRNAATTLSALLNSFGYSDVEIRFQDEQQEAGSGFAGQSAGELPATVPP